MNPPAILIINKPTHNENSTTTTITTRPDTLETYSSILFTNPIYSVSNK